MDPVTRRSFIVTSSAGALGVAGAAALGTTFTRGAEADEPEPPAASRWRPSWSVGAGSARSTSDRGRGDASGRVTRGRRQGGLAATYCSTGTGADASHPTGR
jgi:hypothetical protein